MLTELLGAVSNVNPHYAAWHNSDWSKVEELVAEYKDDPRNNPMFAAMDRITMKKGRCAAPDDYDNGWMNRAFSQHADTLYSAYVMNLLASGIDEQMNFDYYYDQVQQGKRYGKWAKYNEDIEKRLILSCIAGHYKINTRDAGHYHDLAVAKGYEKKLLARVAYLAPEKIDALTKNKTEQNRLKKITEEWQK